jgi:hypothetical protein
MSRGNSFLLIFNATVRAGNLQVEGVVYKITDQKPHM